MLMQLRWAYIRGKAERKQVFCFSTQEFFSLAWSTVLMSRGGGASAQHCSILAAGGKRGLVKLIHPRNNVAYGEFRASRKSLSVLRFNHHMGNFLFSESSLLLSDKEQSSTIRQINGLNLFYSICELWEQSALSLEGSRNSSGPTIWRVINKPTVGFWKQFAERLPGVLTVSRPPHQLV